MKAMSVLVLTIFFLAVGSHAANESSPKTEPFDALKIETGSQAQVRISEVIVTHVGSRINSISFKVTNTTFPPICFIRLALLAPDMRKVMVNGVIPGLEDNGGFLGCLTWGADPCNGPTTFNAAVDQLLPQQSITLTFDTSHLRFPSYSNALEFPPTLTLILTRSCFNEVNASRSRWNDNTQCYKLLAGAP